MSCLSRKWQDELERRELHYKSLDEDPGAASPCCLLLRRCPPDPEVLNRLLVIIAKCTAAREARCPGGWAGFSSPARAGIWESSPLSQGSTCVVELILPMTYAPQPPMMAKPTAVQAPRALPEAAVVPTHIYLLEQAPFCPWQRRGQSS